MTYPYSFVEVTEHYARVQAMMTRLRMISPHDRIVASGLELLPRVVTIKEDMGRLVGAVDEIVTVWQQYLRQFPETDILSGALDDVQSARSASQAMFDRLTDVITNMRLLSIPVLLEGVSEFDRVKSVANSFLR